jgi:S1-C subfamily serine protease
MKLMDLSEELTESLAETIETVKRSLVIVHNGREGAGAGVVWRQGGYIVTNFHVVARGKKGVTLMNGEECTAEIIAQAPEIGVISSLGNVAVKGRRQAVPVIRTDAGLAPGNSGGPLLDAGGGIIGINTMIIGGDLGVAIPSEVVQDFVSESLDRKSRATDFI